MCMLRRHLGTIYSRERVHQVRSRYLATLIRRRIPTPIEKTKSKMEIRTAAVPMVAILAVDLVPTRPTDRIDFDTNADGFVTPLDVLLAINALNQVGSGKLPDLLANQSRFTAPRGYVDLDRDGMLTPFDALVIINLLNSPRHRW